MAADVETMFYTREKPWHGLGVKVAGAPCSAEALAVFLLCRSRIRESCSFLVWVLEIFMAFFTSAIGILKTLVVAIGAGLAVWGVINLLEGYGNDNPGANAHVR